MGYTHYFTLHKVLDRKKFADFSKDVEKIVDYCENTLGINHADGWGNAGTKPEINEDLICLNGSMAQEVGQWTTSEQITIPWPADTADTDEINTDPTSEKVAGNWGCGSYLVQRTAPIDNLTGKGLGDYETLAINPENVGWQFTKTAFRPYDITCTAILIALKHHFGADVKIESDGKEKNWLDGKIICTNLFGYGMEFELE